MPRLRCLLLGLLVVSLGVLAGCGAKTPAPQSVKGRVCYRGAPLVGGLIVFVPDEERGNNGPLIKATLEPDGSFLLSADVPAGWYRVAVAPPASAGASATPADPYAVLPSRYRNPQRSGLQGEVRAGAENLFEFQLDD